MHMGPGYGFLLRVLINLDRFEDAKVITAQLKTLSSHGQDTLALADTLLKDAISHIVEDKPDRAVAAKAAAIALAK